MKEDFDESILDNEVEFKKRFKEIKRPKHIDAIINKSLKESLESSQSTREADEVIERLLHDKNILSRLKAELETV